MQNCKYHPLSQAARACEHCNASYCDACCDESPLQRSRGSEHACFVCGQSLSVFKRAESGVEPFWRRLNAVYRYPLGMSALMVVAITALLSALLTNFGLLIALPSVVITLYSFACLRETAMGNLTAPSVESSFDGSNKPIGSLFILLLFVLFITYMAYDMFGAGAAIFVVAFFTITLPAAIIVIAIDEDFVNVLNPAKLISVVFATGTSYFVMLIFLLIMMSSVAVLVSFFQESEPTFTGVFFQSLISNYYNVVEFHILGYLVYQNRYKLGFESAGSHSDTTSRSQEEWENAKLEILIKAGDYPAAISLSKRQVGEPNCEMWKWTRCFKLMCTGSSFGELKAFMPSYLDKLESMGQHDAMAEAYMVAKKRLKDYSVSENNRCLNIARSLFEIGRYPYVIEMLQNYYKRDADLDQINESLKLLSSSYLKIPGKEKNAQFYQNIYDLRNSNA